MSIADKLNTIAENQQKVYDAGYNNGYAAGLSAGSTGGGSSDDVYYVTFMSEDGATELYKKTVLCGDHCMNPVEMGWLEAPPKDSTETEVFTLSGWALVAGGEADTTALQNVTEDRTVYAAYAASTRYYTVRFFDGETLLNTMQVEYGATADYTAEKDGYQFAGWQPSNNNVVADTDCYAQWEETITFANATFEQINEICEAGQAADYFAVNDVKTVTGSDGSTEFELRIVGINMDDKADGSGKAGITFAITKSGRVAIAESAIYNDSSIYPWWYRVWYNSASIREWLQNEFAFELPAEMQSVIKTVTKTTDYAAYNGSNGPSATYSVSYTSEDTIFVPSLIELGGTYVASGGSESMGVYPGLDIAAERYLYAEDGTKIAWWTRTAGATYEYLVRSAGDFTTGSATNVSNSVTGIYYKVVTDTSAVCALACI